MGISKQIELSVKREIVYSINILLDRYIKEGLSIPQIKKYFSNKTAFATMIKDINSVGRRYFEDTNEYKQYLKKILTETLYDRKSEIDTIKLQNENMKITKYNDFDMQNEAMNYNEISAECLFNNIDYASEDMDILAQFFKTKVEYIEVKNKEYSVYAVTDFKTDITSNNRVKMDVLFLSSTQIVRMKENIIEEILNGVYEKIPQDIEYMGILIKPHTILDKDKLKKSLETIIDKNILNIISTVSKYKYVQEYGDGYHIWKKVK